MTKQPTLTKADLIEEVLKVTELPRKESETIVETIFDSIIEAIQKGEKIEIRGFGSFRTRQRRGRVGRNPKTGEKVEVPAKRAPRTPIGPRHRPGSEAIDALAAAELCRS
jgi:integration host factor subunit beta